MWAYIERNDFELTFDFFDFVKCEFFWLWPNELKKNKWGQQWRSLLSSSLLCVCVYALINLETTIGHRSIFGQWMLDLLPVLGHLRPFSGYKACAAHPRSSWPRAKLNLFHKHPLSWFYFWKSMKLWDKQWFLIFKEKNFFLKIKIEFIYWHQNPIFYSVQLNYLNTLNSRVLNVHSRWLDVINKILKYLR